MNVFKKFTVLTLATMFVITSAFAGSAAAAGDTLKGKITINGSTALLPQIGRASCRERV